MGDGHDTRATVGAINKPAAPDAGPPGGDHLAAGPGIGATAMYRRQYGAAFEDGWKQERALSAKHGDRGHGRREPVDGKSIGEGGFGVRLNAEATDAAASAGAGWGAIAAPVAPVTQPLDDGIARQRAAVVELADSDWYGGDPGWLHQEKVYSQEWATENMMSLIRYKGEQQLACASFASWRNLANASHLALGELVETARLMGFDPARPEDAAAFIATIEHSLDAANMLVDAKVLPGGHSWSRRSDDPSARSLAQPELHGEELAPKLIEIEAAGNAVEGAQAKIYEVLLSARSKELAHEAVEVRGQITQIQSTIDFFAKLAGTASTALRAAPSVAATARGVAARSADGSRLGHQALNDSASATARFGRDQTDVDAMVESPARFDDFETYHDTWGPGGRGASDAGGGVPRWVSLSIPGLVGEVLEMWSEPQLSELQNRLQGIEREAEATGRAKDRSGTEEAFQRLKHTAETYQARVKELAQHGLPDRQQDVIALGRELDGYALEHAAPLAQHGQEALIPAPKHEMFTTAMAVVAKVEQYRLLSRLALDSFAFDPFAKSWSAQNLERLGAMPPPESLSRSRRETGRPPPALPPMTEAETAVYQHIGATYLEVLELDEHWRVRLGGVSSRMSTLMIKLSGNAGAKHAEGKRF